MPPWLVSQLDLGVQLLGNKAQSARFSAGPAKSRVIFEAVRP
jgi:hypothetical protein